MIEELTKEKLIEYKCPESQLFRLLNWENYNCRWFFDKEFLFYASNAEMKIYSDLDAARRIYLSPHNIGFPVGYPELFPEFFEQRLKIYLDENRKILNVIFYEESHIRKFIDNEILIVNTRLDKLKPVWHYARYLIIQLEAYIDYLQNYSKPKDTSNKMTFGTSYKWKGKHEEIKVLYTRMIGKFIANDTTYEQFEAIFSGKPINAPIKWHEESTKILLAYFINKLRTEHKISLSCNSWAIAKCCFDNTKDLQSSLNNNPTPKNHKGIDSLFENL